MKEYFISEWNLDKEDFKYLNLSSKKNDDYLFNASSNKKKSNNKDGNGEYKGLTAYSEMEELF